MALTPTGPPPSAVSVSDTPSPASRPITVMAAMAVLLLISGASGVVVFFLLEPEPQRPSTIEVVEAAPPIQVEETNVEEEPGELPPESIARVLHESEAIRSCFDRESDFVGVLELKFTVASDGRVTSSEVLTERVQGTGLDLCLRINLLLLQFPEFEGEPLTVVYPIMVG